MHYSTLTSLAILKVNIDHGRDYLDYLKPFVLDVLEYEKPETITDDTVHTLLLKKFGLNIPHRSIQVVLKRLSRKYPLKKENKIYKITGALKPNINIVAQKNQAERHIEAVISGLIEFSRSTVKPIDSNERAVKALLDFLLRFNIPCLKAYLRGTTIPDIEQSHKGDIVLVSKYIIKLQKTNPERFESFMILVQGHMLANALTCPDLAQVPETYKGVTFYLDTPLLISLLGLNNEYKKEAVKSLIDLLYRLNGKVSVFSHLRDELKGVIETAAGNLDDIKRRGGSIVMEARRSSKTKSDLLLFAQQIDEKLAEFNISEEQTPKYEYKFQIDEKVFDQALDDEVPHYKKEAKKNDINSVRSIYVLRKGMAPDTVERSKAVLVTSNTKFAKVAWRYGRAHEELRQVSSVITDFSLANMAWLKAPMGASSLPETEVLAFSYSALRPTKDFLNKYLTEIEKLDTDQTITERDHQLLRSSIYIEKELMSMTMGDEQALNEETITEILKRVTSEIKKEESEKLTEEQKQHKTTKEKLDKERQKKHELQDKLYWRCDKKAKLYSWNLTGLIIILQVVLIFISIWFKFSLVYTIILSLLIVIFNIFGLSSWKIHKKIKNTLLSRFLKKEEDITGLNLTNKDNQNKGRV